MRARKIARIVAFGLLLSMAVAAAGIADSAAMGSRSRVGLSLDPTVKAISIHVVLPGSPAALGGIAVGDSIIKLEGVVVAGSKALDLRGTARRDVGET